MSFEKENSMFFGANPFIFEKAKELRKQQTESEEKLWNCLRKNQMGFKFRRQHPIYNYIADFYCHPIKLVIEIDGEYHLESEQKEYDKLRSEDLAEFGITVVRFSNAEVLNNIEFVITRIKENISKLKQ